MKYRQFIEIIEANGFVCVRIKAMHRQFKGTVDGLTSLVTVDYAKAGEDIIPKNLASMIRQSGRSKKFFR